MKLRYGLLLLSWLLTVSAGFAQTDLPTDSTQSLSTVDLANMSLEDLLKMQNAGLSSELEKTINSLIAVASQKPQSTRKTPGIISLITEEEIAASGARDLIDVLRLVPGFDFGSDTQGSVGMGIRGNWAHEGKVLLLLDGQEMNETLYSTLVFGNHFDVSQIKRIEIIRGPGSAIYGGYAEYGVVSIITKNHDDLKGLQITGTYGQMTDTYGRRNLSVSAGKRWGDLAASLAVFVGQGQRSDQTYQGLQNTIDRIDTVYQGNQIERVDTSYRQESYRMAGQSALNPFNVNLGLAYKGWSFRAIVDRYQTTDRSGYDMVLSQPYVLTFDSYLAELKYTWKINSKLTLTPRFNFKRQLPWRNTQAADEMPAYDRAAHRYRGNLTLHYDLSRKLNLVFGGEFFDDLAYSLSRDGQPFYNEQLQLNFSNQALFTQMLFKHSLAYLTVGARYDYNSAFGSAFVPRIGITRKMDKLHLKLLYANSFRAPGIENINLAVNQHLKPEKTQVIELEAGYQLSKATLLSVNLFDIHTSNPIVYSYDIITDTEMYRNYERTGSRGLELELKWKGHWGFVNANYAFYSTAGRRQVDAYELPEPSAVRLAFPAHKVNLNASFKIVSNLSVNPSFSLQSSRYGYVSPDQIGRFRPVFLCNLFVRKQHFLLKGLDAGIGVYDLLNERVAFIQPYNGGHVALPGPSREVIARITYHLPFNAKH